MVRVFSVFSRKPSTAAQNATSSKLSFVIDGADGLPEVDRLLLEGLATEITRSIPALALHQVFGDMANRLTLRPGRPDVIEVTLGPKCGGGCSGGATGQQATVKAIARIIAQRPEVRAGMAKYRIFDTKNAVLARN